ncbi:MAG: class I SAM-dependent methyltransferase [Anaerolineales bacterium]|nr:class I SAM-dependent methyltransferase [Anaerolineales bacterium]
MFQDEFPPEYFSRQDERDDQFFYSVPRKVVHIDEPAIQTLSNAFLDLIPEQGTILDLMSSWRTHLPIDELEPERVVGLGMNAVEMEDNPQLDEFIIHDLNAVPKLPYADDEFDAVLCSVSVQYLIRPVEVFAEVNRVLKPGGKFIVSFSNRCFPTKATALWIHTNDEQHVQLVVSYFQKSGVDSAGWVRMNARIKSEDTGAAPNEDPLYIVWAEKG